MSFQDVPPRGSLRTGLILQQWMVTAHVKCFLPRKLIRDPAHRLLLGAGHVGTLSLTNIKLLNFAKESRGVA